MMIKLKRLLLASLTVVLLGGCGKEDKESLKPNIIFIMADDLGYGDLGCYGQEKIKTPNIDKMASEGLRFTDFYAGNTVCAPSRTTLMTGLHQGHAPIRGNKENVLKDEYTTIAEVLKSVGYKTGLIGKWGLGEVGTSGDPNNQGFDYYFAYLNQKLAHNHFPDHLIRNGEKVKLNNKCIFEKTSYSDNLGSAATEKNEYSQDLFTADALEFIERSKDNPFFLYLSYTIPHTNNEGYLVDHHGMEVPNYGIYANKDWPDEEKSKASMISWLDADVGEILNYIENIGLSENTLVIFTSDNGPHKEGVDPEFFESNKPFKGIKRELYEGGIRVPMIVWWKGKVKPGSICNHPSAFWDILPTFAQVAGAELKQDIDGISILPSIIGNSKNQKQHEYLYWEFAHPGNKTSTQAVRSGTWKLLYNKGSLELYNLELDIGEQKNLASDYPEIVEQLKTQMDEAHKYHATYPLMGE